MVLGWRARPSTRDVDAIFVPAEAIRQIADRVGKEEGLPRGWLNDGVKGFLQALPERATLRPVFSDASLEVYVPAPEYLLAMKALAARTGPEFEDAEDLRRLAKVLDIRSPEAVFRLVERYFPKGRIPAKTRFFVESILGGEKT